MTRRDALAAVVLTVAVAAAGCQESAETGMAEEEAEGPAKEVLMASQGAPYSPVVRGGDLLFLSGAIGVDDDAEEQGAPGETRRSLEGIQERLEDSGASLEDVVKCTVFLTDMDDYGDMNDVYSEFFPEDPPARSAVAVAELPADAEVEIECIAVAE